MIWIKCVNHVSTRNSGDKHSKHNEMPVAKKKLEEIFVYIKLGVIERLPAEISPRGMASIPNKVQMSAKCDIIACRQPTVVWFYTRLHVSGIFFSVHIHSKVHFLMKNNYQHLNHRTSGFNSKTFRTQQKKYPT